MKRILITLLVLLVGTVAIACNNETIKTEDVEKLVKEYKTEQYNIKEPTSPPTGIEIGNKVKKYLSKEAYEKLKANRTFQIAPDFAITTNKSIELEDVILKKEKEYDNGTEDYSYTLKLKIYDDDPRLGEVFEKKGQFTISNDGGLKITRDREEIVKIGEVAI